MSIRLPSSVIKMLLSTRPPIPQRVRASNETRVIDEINSNNRASNFEPAIRIILEHLYRMPLISQKNHVPFYTWRKRICTDFVILVKKMNYLKIIVLFVACLMI